MEARGVVEGVLVEGRAARASTSTLLDPASLSDLARAEGGNCGLTGGSQGRPRRPVGGQAGDAAAAGERGHDQDHGGR
jgi:hypothetical protein